MDQIIKRDGRIVDYDPIKITNAIWAAAKAVGGTDFNRAVYLTRVIESALDAKYPDKIASVEQVQDQVEKTLVKSGHYKTAKAYILYRKQHHDNRNYQALVTLNNDVIEKYVSQNDWRVNENSNMTFSMQGMNFHISGRLVEDYWLHRLYSDPIRQAHESGDIHIHDISVLGPYCVGWDLQDLLAQGFKGVKGKVASKPPKHFRVALGQIFNYLFTLQGEAAGAQAFSNFDTLLAPFIRYDKLNYKQVKQGLQEFIFNMNVPTRVGFQTPFSNLTMDVICPSHLKNTPVIIGGEYKEETYGDFQKEMDMFNLAFTEVMTEGDAEERVFTFPIPTYNITEDFDWDNPQYDHIWKMTARYGIPYFSNFVGSDLDPEDARSMCCRLRLDNRELQKRGGGLFGANPLTGSIGVVTINMPRLGYQSHSKEDFFLRLGLLMDIASQSLEIKRKVIENLTEQNLYPYTKHYLRSVKEATGRYWTNHFSTIGLIGMNEACINLLGVGIADPEGEKFSVEVLNFMRKRLSCYQEKTGNLYNLEATPAEGCSYSLLLKDKKLFGNSYDYPYYTNSTQLPVNYTDDLLVALKHQEALQELYTGGTVFHVFLGESPQPEAVKRLLQKMVQFKIPYYSVTPSFSVCENHGYLKGEQYTCPNCGEETEVYSRVVGYLRPTRQYNVGKKREAVDRKKFDSAFKV
jgi:anaerobic ribonucleoside-triphosphate reductase